MATRIIKLEMKGFKSFAKHTDILFKDNFNVILGPNGSGKSNVIDALCFVLGKSSAKGLRAEKSANLIYNGGKTKNPAKEGEVSIYFCNKEKDFPLDTEEVKISRIVKASGQSVYKINDKTHTRTEVLDALHGARINPDGHNIILQGDIVRFVEMSGEERRRIIEQIADISIYEEKKNKALSELDKVEISLKEAQIILNERKSYLKDLSKEKEQAIKYEQVEKLLKQAKATLLAQSISEKEEGINKINEKNKGTLEKKDELQKEIDELKAIIKTKKEEIATINRTIEERGDANQVALHKQIEEEKVVVATMTQKVDSLEENIQKVEERKKQLTDSHKEVGEKVTALAKEIEVMQGREQKLKAQKEEFKEKITAFKKKHNLEGTNEVEAQIEELDKQIEEQQKSVDTIREEYQDTLRAKDRLEMQIRNADEKIDKVASITKEHKKELDALKQKKVEFKKVTVELSQSLQQDSSLASQVANARSKNHFLGEELAKLQARRASIQETLGGSMAIAKLIENKNKIGGVYGTVSSLGTVEERYAKALEVAAGTKIKAIAVESDAVAQKCIEFLKKNQLGVATFLPLNKIKANPRDPQAAGLTKDGRVHGFAVDIIKYDAKFQKVFAHVFGNTLIVNDMASARSIGIGAAKMVTLDGDVAEKSGVMQGGYRKNASTGLGFTHKEVSDKTEKLEKEQADIQSLLSRLEKEKTEHEDKIANLRELKANLEGDIIKVEKGLHLDDSDLEMSLKLKDEFEKELEATSKRMIELQNTVSQQNRDLASKKVEKQKMRMQVAELKNPTKLAELNVFEQKVQQITEELIRLESEIKHSTNQKKNILEPEVEKSQEIIKQHQKEIDGYQVTQKELQTEIKTKKESLKELEQKEKEFYAKFKEAFDKRNKLQDEIEKTESKTIQKEEQIRELERRANAVSIELAKFQAEISVLKDEYKDYEGVELLEGKETQELKHIVYNSETQLKNIGPVNMKAVQMYDKVQEEYDKLIVKRDVLSGEKENVLMMINEIEVRKKDLFLLVFERLNNNFQRIFKTILTKGEAFIELENPEQPFEGGVNVKVKLSGNKFMDIRSLSGGEKTMTALAFIFAIQENDPSSFYIMDEVDAALDKKNAEKLAELVAAYSDTAQYIVISHNDGVISSANILYGVSMDQQTGISKVVSLKL